MAIMPGTEGQIDQQKAALLSAIAQQGTQGQTAFNAEQQRRLAAQQAAQANIAAMTPGATGNAGGTPKALTAELQAQQAMLGSIYSQDAALSQKGFDSSIAQTKTANDSYMQQAAASVPIVRSQTEGVIARIRQEQQEAEAERQFQAEQRAYEAQQRALDAQYAEEDRAFQREQMAEERKVMQQGDEEENLESFYEKIAEGQENVLRKSTREDDPAVPEFVEIATSTADDLPQALKFAFRSIAAAQEAGEGKVEGYSKNSRMQIARRLYEYYTGKPAPQGMADLEDALESEGASVNDIHPGYVPTSERKRREQGARTDYIGKSTGARRKAQSRIATQGRSGSASGGVRTSALTPRAPNLRNYGIGG